MSAPAREEKICLLAAGVPGLALLSSLNVVWPRTGFEPFTTEDERANGLPGRYGLAIATWTWDFIYTAARTALYAYCTNELGTDVIIRTRNNKHTYVNYYASLIWPGSEEWIAGKSLKFILTFKNLETV